MKFHDMPYQRPDMDKTIAFLKKVKQQLEHASSGAEQINIIYDYIAYKKKLDTAITLASVRHTIDTTDQFYEEENAFMDENTPIITNLGVEVSRCIYHSPFRKELEEEFGTHYFKLLECNLVLNEKAIPFMQKENELVSKYSKIIATSQIEFEGKIYTLTQMTPLLQDTDRNRRFLAYKARNKFLEEHLDEFDAIYDELVKVRTEMAVALGYKNYVELQYKLLNRTDYNHEDVAVYREKILKTFTPFSVELRKEQAKRLGIDDFKFYDIACEFQDGNANPIGDETFIIAKAKEMYEDLSPETGTFFNFMIENELMDLLAKPGKRAGGYCTSFDEYKSPFIFSNFNGTKGDIDVITHEAGHAFQNFMSQDMKLPEYIWPTYEACEIHSMSMEFLTWPYMELFFGNNVNKFKYTALKSAISFLPYGATIDHFQHFVYENPTATPEERRKKYREIELMYRPDLDYADEFLDKGTYWFLQAHVFSVPFYYIDYTLAQVCAFQYLIKYLENREQTLQEYITLCKAGGSQSFFDLIETGKLKNPMTTSVMEDIVPTLDKIIHSIKI